MKKNIILTFDYELSLGGKSGSVQKCMLEPTDLILDVLKNYSARAIFFIDTPYLLRLEELSEKFDKVKEDYFAIKNQLIRIANEGHYVYHHIHPHWLDAKYIPEENQWNMSDKSKYTVYQLTDDERKQVFKASNRILTEILSESENSSKPEGYRAGGLYIEPFSAFKPYFIEHGIVYEFSTVPYLSKVHDKYFYDFSRCPEDPIYRFEDEAAIKNSEGQFLQYTISKFKLKGLRKILNGIYYRLSKLENKRYTDGQSVSVEFNSSDEDSSSNSYFESDNILSIELMNPVLLGWFKNIVKKNDYVHILSHPKLLTPISIEQFDSLMKSINRKYSIEYDFKKMYSE